MHAKARMAAPNDHAFKPRHLDRVRRWSEQLAPSLCAVLAHQGLTCAPLRAEHLPEEADEERLYHCSARVSEDEYRRLCEASIPTVGTLLHALKF